MNLCTDVIDAEPRTGQKNALCIITPEQEYYIRGDNKEIINGYSMVYHTNSLSGSNWISELALSVNESSRNVFTPARLHVDGNTELLFICDSLIKINSRFHKYIDFMWTSHMQQCCNPRSFVRWSEQLVVYPRTNKQNQKKKRKVEPATSQVFVVAFWFSALVGLMFL